MAYLNKYDKDKSCFEAGETAEQLFKKIILSKGLKIREATKKQQFDHIDFFVIFPDGKEESCEIKSLKKINRNNSFVQSEKHWVELLNTAGNKGWLYGSMDKIYLQFTPTAFIGVLQKDLVKLVEGLLTNKRVYSPEESLHCLYTRRNREDLLTTITHAELLSIPHEILCF